MNDSLKTLSLAVLLGSVTSSLHAVAFDSGSDGSDGALVFAADQGEVVFDPDNYDPVLDADGDGIYHFTAITVGQGTYVRLGGDVLGHKPLIWLASGDVVIEGELNLGYSGSFGGDVPGVGGFSGGKAAGPTSGQGPGGGSTAGEAYEEHVNSFLIPLIGGSGAGAYPESDGSAGGGAMLLASSGQIFHYGYISGAGAAEYSKSGNIRLMANRLSGDGDINEFNVIRIEVYDISFQGSFSADNVVKTRPGPVFRNHPIKITVIDSLPVDQTKPGANKDAPDVTINNGNGVTVKVECTGIPLGTTIQVHGWNDTVGEVLGVTDGLTGTLEASSATCTMVIPTGNTTFMARANLGP